ncbi:MAG: ClpXP protease specificity-enhancing factor SspB [Paracoccaceae bacterium]
MTTSIDYGNLMHDAMRGLIQNVLEDVAVNGLPGDHHFFITFDTLHEKVDIASWLTDRYPEEMTIVVQNWFENLNVTDEGFTITLNFGDNPEPLYVPFDALKTFVDPSVEFGLRFDSQGDGSDETDAPHVVKEVQPLQKTKPEAENSDILKKSEKVDEKQAADIVSLDSFRK